MIGESGQETQKTFTTKDTKGHGGRILNPRQSGTRWDDMGRDGMNIGAGEGVSLKIAVIADMGEPMHLGWGCVSALES